MLERMVDESCAVGVFVDAVGDRAEPVDVATTARIGPHIVGVRSTAPVKALFVVYARRG